ncbi:hypothetical protein [Mesorhizobium sp. 43Arga]
MPEEKHHPANALLESIHRHTDAGFVLIATQLLANALEILLVSNMPGINRDLYKRFFRGFGPMAALSSKIYFCEAFGIIDKEMAAELHTLREIRNLFAHAVDTLDFTRASVQALAAKLNFPKDGHEELSIRYFVAAVSGAGADLEKLTKPIPEEIDKLLKNLAKQPD